MAIENECANSQNCKLCDWNKKIMMQTVLLSGPLNSDSLEYFVIYSKSPQESFRILGFSCARSIHPFTHGDF